MEAHQLHRPLCLAIFHEVTPDKPAAAILRHKHRDPLIDAKDVPVGPTGEGIESVDEPISFPGLTAVAVVNVRNSIQRFRGQERD
jgi:hypothetical protein